MKMKSEYVNLELNICEDEIMNLQKGHHKFVNHEFLKGKLQVCKDELMNLWKWNYKFVNWNSWIYESEIASLWWWSHEVRGLDIMKYECLHKSLSSFHFFLLKSILFNQLQESALFLLFHSCLLKSDLNQNN